MSQIQKKFIADRSIDGAKIVLLNAQTLKARNAANTADVDILLVNNANQVEFQNLPYVNASLAIPSAPKQLATIEYVQNLISGKTDVKDAVQAAATSNTALTGSSPFVADGYTFTVTTPVSRVLLAFQSTATENGIYDVEISGGVYTLVRSADFDGPGDVTNGAWTRVVNGTQFAGYEAVVTTGDPITVGTTAISFALYPSSVSIVAGDGLSKTNNTLSVDLAPLGGLESTSPGSDSGQIRVKTDTASLEKDKTTRIDTSSGAVVAKKSKKEVFTLSGTDISNGYIDLANVAEQDSVILQPTGGQVQNETDDYTVNYTGGASSKTRVTFAGGLAVGGVSALATGDTVVVYYRAF